MKELPTGIKILRINHNKKLSFWLNQNQKEAKLKAKKLTLLVMIKNYILFTFVCQ